MARQTGQGDGIRCEFCTWVGRSKGAMTRHIRDYHTAKDGRVGVVNGLGEIVEG